MYIFALTDNYEVGPPREFLPIITRKLLSALQYGLLGTVERRPTCWYKIVLKDIGPVNAVDRIYIYMNMLFTTKF